MIYEQQEIASTLLSFQEAETREQETDLREVGSEMRTAKFEGRARIFRKF